MNIKKLKNRKGFTLIELVVVIAILGILIAIIVPKIDNTMVKAKEVAFEAEIKTLRQAAILFTIDYPNTPVIWESFAGQKADRTLEITDKNLHDTWNKYLEVYPQDPSRPVGNTFRIEIYENGDIQIIPDRPASKED